MDEMNPYDRLRAAIELKPVDRVPVAPKLDTSFAARSHGVKLADVVRSADRGREVLEQTFADLGGCDGALQAGMNDLGLSVLGIVTRLPGYHLGEDDMWQFDEQEIMQVEDYDFIIQNGWLAYVEMAYGRLVEKGMPVPVEKFGIRLGEAFAREMKDMDTWEAMGVPTLFGFGPFIPLEGFRFTRSFQALITDLFRRPEKFLAAADACLDEQIPLGIKNFKAVKENKKWGYLSFQIGQTTGSMLSPKQFIKFYWPHEKRLINALVESGITPWLHCDSNWTPFLEYFLELPKGKIVLDLDGMTDIFKAKQVLKDHMCISGDVPAALLKLGTPEEVNVYCRKLIDNIGDGGGFILSSGCSVPVDAKLENVKAMVDTGKSYYPHGRVFTTGLA
jgi:Uroporphyrinogen decarboxylase (URO-D)